MNYDFNAPVDRSANFSAKYDERKAKFGTDDVIPLWIADMDLPGAQPIVDALVERAKQGIFGYTTRPDSYFASVREWQLRRNGWDTDTALYSFCPGVVSALCTLVMNHSRPGDNILIQTPVYPHFFDVVEDWDRTVLESPLVMGEDGQYTIDFADFEEKLRQGPSIFILCNPHNPGGRVWTKEELCRMGELCLRYHVLILSDEIHADLMLWGNKHTPMAMVSPEIAAITVTCTSATKTFNLAGLQACTIISPNRKTKGDFDRYWSNIDIARNNCFSLVAVEAAFRHGEEWLEQMLRHVEENLRYVQAFFAGRLPGVRMALPQSTYLAWIDFRSLGLAPDQLVKFLIEEAKIALNDGRSFGKQCGGYMRLNTACPRPQLEQALNQLDQAVERRGLPR